MFFSHKLLKQIHSFVFVHVYMFNVRHYFRVFINALDYSFEKFERQNYLILIFIKLYTSKFKRHSGT